MKKTLLIAGATLALISCNMKNPLLTESTAPFGAPEFDKIKNEHYKTSLSSLALWEHQPCRTWELTVWRRKTSSKMWK